MQSYRLYVRNFMKVSLLFPWIFRKAFLRIPIDRWEKVFKSRPSKICRRQPLKNFNWSILEYLDSYILHSDGVGVRLWLKTFSDFFLIDVNIPNAYLGPFQKPLIIFLEFFKGCLPQSLLGPLLNTLSQILLPFSINFHYQSHCKVKLLFLTLLAFFLKKEFLVC